MNRDEFIAATKSYNKRTMVLLLSPFLLIMLATAAYAPYFNRVEDYLETKFTWAVSAVLAIAPIAFPAVAALLVVSRILRRIEKNLSVNCPHCHNSVIQFERIVIATRNCPFCGMQVLDEKNVNYA
jgi:predicted Zn-ribbon and HTH transcriptional regulator